MTDVVLSLVSHTNVGKTTLARTLLQRDVGEVHDQAHVTEVSEAHEALAAEGHRLLLWDTPGFGDSARLAKRLAGQANPLGWILSQVWDRLADRPLWCSQQAVRNVRDEADIVLYLVNASEHPDDAGYLGPELDVLQWIGKPVLLLLNQTGGTSHVEPWEHLAARRSFVRGVLPLDAFTRCWVEEGVLFERASEVLEGDKRAALQVLARAWNDRHMDVFKASMAQLAMHLARAAADREPLKRRLSTKEDRENAMRALAERLAASEHELWRAVIAAHGLEGEAAAELTRRLEDVSVEGQAPDLRKSATLGGIFTGVLGGLAADILAGGLSLGGGMITGAILGALGGAGMARGAELLLGADPGVRWSAEFLQNLSREAVLRYLHIAHFGRGRGRFEDGPSARWRAVVDAVFERDGALLAVVWSERKDPSLERVLTHRVGDLVRGILSDAYPDAPALREEVESR